MGHAFHGLLLLYTLDLCHTSQLRLSSYVKVNTAMAVSRNNREGKVGGLRRNCDEKTDERIGIA